jgi:hypothetical protein
MSNQIVTGNVTGYLESVFHPEWTYTSVSGFMFQLNTSLMGNVDIGDTSTNYTLRLNGQPLQDFGVASLNNLTGILDISTRSSQLSISTAGTSNTIYIDWDGGPTGVTSLNGLSGPVTLTNSGVGIQITSNAPSQIFIKNTGVTSISGAVGAIELIGGSNVSVTKSGNTFTISAAGGGTTITGVTSLCGLTGVVGLSAGTGIGLQTFLSSSEIAITNTGVTTLSGTLSGDVAFTASGVGIAISTSGNGLAFANTGVTSICGAVGYITLEPGNGNVQITQNTSGIFQISATGGGGSFNGGIIDLSGQSNYIWNSSAGNVTISGTCTVTDALIAANNLHVANGNIQLTNGNFNMTSGNFIATEGVFTGNVVVSDTVTCSELHFNPSGGVISNLGSISMSNGSTIGGVGTINMSNSAGFGTGTINGVAFIPTAGAQNITISGYNPSGPTPSIQFGYGGEIVTSNACNASVIGGVSMLNAQISAGFAGTAGNLTITDGTPVSTIQLLGGTGTVSAAQIVANNVNSAGAVLNLNSGALQIDVTGISAEGVRLENNTITVSGILGNSPNALLNLGVPGFPTAAQVGSVGLLAGLLSTTTIANANQIGGVTLQNNNLTVPGTLDVSSISVLSNSAYGTNNGYFDIGLMRVQWGYVPPPLGNGSNYTVTLGYAFSNAMFFPIAIASAKDNAGPYNNYAQIAAVPFTTTTFAVDIINGGSGSYDSNVGIYYVAIGLHP